MPSFKAPRGAPDLLPPRSEQLQGLVRACEDLFQAYAYRRIETPIFEETALFERGLEGNSDLVTKEMYTFLDRSDRSLTLRPEGTAPVMRAVLEHNLHKGRKPVKLYYAAPSFRYERPQAGRQRAFLQVGVEAIGSPGPQIDAEVVELGSRVFDKLGIEVKLQLNSIGHSECRAKYLPVLVEYLNAHRDQLCEDCQRKIESNPLRTFDCKVPADRKIMASAPLITYYLCDECTEHFDGVRRLLGEAGVAFNLEPRLVRGLDYYTRTTFAWTAAGLGSQDEAGGGGRYDGLSELLGGPPLPGVGFGLGAERMLLALEKSGPVADETLDVFVAQVGRDGFEVAMRLASRLRDQGLRTDLDFEARNLSAQFKAADRGGARHVVVIGEKELASGQFTVREMSSGVETPVTEANLVKFLKDEV